MPNMSPSGESAMTVAGLLAAVIAGIFHFRRKASRDSTEIVKDRAEGQLFAQMMTDREGILKERDAARSSEREAWDHANKCAVINAKLQSDNEYMQQEIKRLTQMVSELQVTLDQVRNKLQSLASGHLSQSDLGNI